jgi:Asp-tRNA(Asn)/Glu-tRNA(Gln) amidotransferase A subunit family amidase
MGQQRTLAVSGVTARELVETAIARHERFGEQLHAYSLWAPEQARVVAQAPMPPLPRG